MKVAIFSAKSYDRVYLDKFNTSSQHELSYFETSLDSHTTNLALGFDAVCVFVNDKVNNDTLQKLAAIGIKLVVLRCAGFNNVDIASALEHGITVVRVPAYAPQAVAEHAVALILTLNRKTHKAYNRIRESNFSLENLAGFNLYQKTVGIIGTGKIGAAFARIMIGFGCHVIAHDLFPSAALEKSGVEYTTIAEVLKRSDIISLHCPLTPETHHLLNRESLVLVKKGTMIINTSRGALINTADVIEALKNEQIGYLGIDVYEQEENLFFKDLSESLIQDDLIERLMSFHNVLITPHQGFFTKEALDEIASTTLQNLTDFEAGRLSGNEVKLAP